MKCAKCGDTSQKITREIEIKGSQDTTEKIILKICSRCRKATYLCKVCGLGFVPTTYLDERCRHCKDPIKQEQKEIKQKQFEKRNRATKEARVKKIKEAVENLNLKKVELPKYIEKDVKKPKPHPIPSKIVFKRIGSSEKLYGPTHKREICPSCGLPFYNSHGFTRCGCSD